MGINMNWINYQYLSNKSTNNPRIWKYVSKKCGISVKESKYVDNKYVSICERNVENNTNMSKRIQIDVKIRKIS